MKQTFLKTITLLLITIIFIACEKEDNLTTETILETEIAEYNYSINYVSSDQIPNIINLLGGNNNTSSKSGSSKSSTIFAPFGAIAIESALEVIDTLGNQNYSFTLIPKTPKPNSIFNLVVSSVNDTNNIAIMEYRMSSDFAESYRNGTKTIAEFTGNIFTFPFTPSSNLFAKSNINTCIQNIDEIVDCSFINVNNGSVTGGGTGGSRTIGDISDPLAGNTFEGIPTGGGGTAVWVCKRYGEEHPEPTGCGTEGGGGIGEGTWIITLFPAGHTYKTASIKTETNCCDGTNVTGSIGVNLLTPMVNYITNCIPNLSQQQINFLNESLHSFAIKNYLEENKNPNGSFNQNACEFVKFAIDVLINNKASTLEAILNDYIIRINTSETQKIENIKEELKCFDKNKPAKFTIYVEQAIKESREVTAELGHTFIGLEQNGIIRNLGFYPQDNTAAVRNVNSEIHDNSNSPYHVSISTNISASQLKDIITYIEAYPSIYNLNEYNCSDFGIILAEKSGIDLPKKEGVYTVFGLDYFKGRNPSDLGEDMRELTLPIGATRNLEGGKAPKRSTDCQYYKRTL